MLFLMQEVAENKKAREVIASEVSNYLCLGRRNISVSNFLCLEPL